MDPRIHLYSIEPAGARRLPVPEDARNVHTVLDDRALGIYTAFRTYRGDSFFGLEEHLDRADMSMELCGWSERLDRPLLRRGLQQAVTDYGAGKANAGVRFDVLAPAERAPGGAGLDGRMLLTLAPFVPVERRCREEGVRVDLAGALSRDTPRIKRAHFAVERRPYPLNRQDRFDHLLLDAAGRVLEATSANVFARIGDRLWTAGEGVLEGITRRFVLLCAEELGLQVRLEALPLAHLQGADEAFLSSSTRGVVPIVEILDRKIGAGVPGEWTLRLQAALEARIEAAAQPAWPCPRAATGTAVGTEG